MLNDQTLFFGLPIKIDENVTLYQPTLNEMIEQGFNSFGKINTASRT